MRKQRIRSPKRRSPALKAALSSALQNLEMAQANQKQFSAMSDYMRITGAFRKV